MTTQALSGDISDLARARAIRLEADRKAPMSERLARVHALCKQMSAIKGAARAQSRTQDLLDLENLPKS